MIPKRRILSLKEKGEIIAEVDRSPHISKVRLAEKFSLATSTLATIMANRDAILKTIAKCGAASSKRKNSRSSPYQYLEDKLLDWLIDRQEKSLPINSMIIREQAKLMAEELGVEKFTASSGWIDRFKNRHGLGCKAVFDESVAECKNRWAAIRDTFPETTEPRKKSKGGDVPYTQSIYDSDNVPTLRNASSEKTSSHLLPLENSTWPADYPNYPGQSSLDEGPNVNFPEIKIEVESFDDGNKTGGNEYIVPNSVYEAAQPSVPKKRAIDESDERIGSVVSKKRREQCDSDSVAVTETEYKPPKHPIETFFKSMAATVMTFPPHLMAIAKLNVCKLITELELRALTEKSPADANKETRNDLLSENVPGVYSTSSGPVENGALNKED